MGRKPQSEAERSEKSQKILASAGEKISALSYDEVKISDIAASVGMAKGTVFLYFPTKEHLFFRLFTDVIRDWFQFLGETCEQLMDEGRSGDVEEFLSTLVLSLEHFSMLPRALVLLHTRVFPEMKGNSKRTYINSQLEMLDAGGELLESFFPYMEKGTGIRLYARIFSLFAAAEVYSLTWITMRSIGGEQAEDPIFAEGAKPHSVSEDKLLTQIDRDFYIQSVRRLLKGYSLQ